MNETESAALTQIFQRLKLWENLVKNTSNHHRKHIMIDTKLNEIPNKQTYSIFYEHQYNFCEKNAEDIQYKIT